MHFLVACHIHHDSGGVIAENVVEPSRAAFSGAGDLGAGGSTCDLTAGALRGQGERRRGVLSRQRRCAGERSVEARHIVPHHPVVVVLHNKKTAHAVPLASARQHPENQKENQAGHSSERTVEGQGGGRPALGSQPEG